MKKVIIYGSGSTGERIFNQVKNKYQVVAFLDSSEEKWGKEICGIRIVGNESELDNYTYDMIIIATLSGMNDIKNSLVRAGVAESAINSEFVLVQTKARESFLKCFASEYGGRELNACVAEGGVYRGEFASVINEVFANRDLYLFDTFEGFDARDVEIESRNGFSLSLAGHLNSTSEKIVMDRMAYKEKVHIKKGFFPETLKGLDDKKWLFVNLDFDLYSPTFEALKFFYDKMILDGCILIHDYFNPAYRGIQQAIGDYEKICHRTLIKMPIGDMTSIAIIKQ